MFSPKQLFLPLIFLSVNMTTKCFTAVREGKTNKKKKKRKKENIWENAGEFPPGHLSLMENMGIGGVRSEEKQTETRARDTEIIFIWCTTGKFILAAQQKKIRLK